MKHEPKVYVLSAIFGCLIFATIDNIQPWIGAEYFIDALIAIGETLKNGLAYIVAIGFFSGICYLIMDLWITNSKNPNMFIIKYIFICIVSITIVGVGFASAIN